MYRTLKTGLIAKTLFDILIFIFNIFNILRFCEKKFHFYCLYFLNGVIIAS
ncbi:hypothetical protein HMPREF1421_01146 [Helicobacter pylori GAM265BSii]|uniref:Uncharacterized protein n=1 Tax=Helicobacter pylori GAM265BSii TaxID=1159049 RepID=M3R9A0_HELPX|nr:hypothetical protein HMPREF1421_01146 [Helicobacter pylori GAM265BSii]